MPRDFAYWIIEHRPFSSVEDFITRLPKIIKRLAFLTPLVEVGLLMDLIKIVKNLNQSTNSIYLCRRIR